MDQHAMTNTPRALILISGSANYYWNEWGKGAHLEPDCRYGRRYLEATANVPALARQKK